MYELLRPKPVELYSALYSTRQVRKLYMYIGRPYMYIVELNYGRNPPMMTLTLTRNGFNVLTPRHRGRAMDYE